MEPFAGETKGVSREDASKAVLAVAWALVKGRSDPQVRAMVSRFGEETTVDLLSGVRVDAQLLDFGKRAAGSRNHRLT